MELIVQPRHPAAADVGSSAQSQPDVGAGFRPGALTATAHHGDYSAATAHHFAPDHDHDDCAYCLILAGSATDATERHYEHTTGKLHG